MQTGSSWGSCACFPQWTQNGSIDTVLKETLSGLGQGNTGHPTGQGAPHSGLTPGGLPISGTTHRGGSREESSCRAIGCCSPNPASLEFSEQTFPETFLYMFTHACRCDCHLHITGESGQLLSHWQLPPLLCHLSVRLSILQSLALSTFLLFNTEACSAALKMHQSSQPCRGASQAVTSVSTDPKDMTHQPIGCGF